RGGKGWLYEGGIRVPTIIRWPEVTKPGSKCAIPIISNDYFPTLCEAAGARVSADNKVDGLSLVSLLRGGKLQARALYWDYPHYGNQGGAPASAIRDGNWKLIEWREDQSIELFELVTDPGEQRNLVDDKPDVAARLRKKLQEWRCEIGAKMPTPNPNYFEP